MSSTVLIGTGLVALILCGWESTCSLAVSNGSLPPIYEYNEHWLPLLAAAVKCLLTIEHAWSRDHAISLVTAVLPPPGHRYGTAAGHHLQTIPTIVENVYVWLVGLWRPVSER